MNRMKPMPTDAASVVQISGESYRLKDKRRAGIVAKPAKGGEGGTKTEIA